MMLASLVLLQIFTETITPKAGGQCVAVTYKDKTYTAMSVARSRLTGRVTLTMRGAAIPATEAEISECANTCLGKLTLTNSCVASCSSGSLNERIECARACVPPMPPPPPPTPAARSKVLGQPRRNYDTFVPASFTGEPVSMAACEIGCRESRIRFSPGREIELAGADRIVNPSGCPRLSSY